MPAPTSGQLLVRTLYLSIDPYMRGRMSAAPSYAQPVAVGETMEGEAIAEVVQSRDADYHEGDLVRSRVGWRTHAIVDTRHVSRIQPGAVPITAYLGVLGMPGFTAYAGLKVIGQPKPGETLVVSAAAGPVGSLVGQLAKLAGARAVGIAGGAMKCRYLMTTLGFDSAVDRHAEDFARVLQELCPDGIDIYFENAGGATWPAVLPLLNRYARVPVCGLIALYNGVSQTGRDWLPDADGTPTQSSDSRLHQYRVCIRALQRVSARDRADGGDQPHSLSRAHGGRTRRGTQCFHRNAGRTELGQSDCQVPGLISATPEPQIDASGLEALRMAWGLCPKVRRKLRRMRSPWPSPVATAMPSTGSLPAARHD